MIRVLPDTLISPTQTPDPCSIKHLSAHRHELMGRTHGPQNKPRNIDDLVDRWIKSKRKEYCTLLCAGVSTFLHSTTLPNLLLLRPLRALRLHVHICQIPEEPLRCFVNVAANVLLIVKIK